MPDFAEEEKLVQLSGSGGGGKGGGDRKPEEEDDNLFSRAEASVLLAVAEGPVEGFAESEKQSVYLNDTPIENEKGDNNFDGTIELRFENGTLRQEAMPGFKDVKVEQSVGILCVQDIAVPVTTTSNNYWSDAKPNCGWYLE